MKPWALNKSRIFLIYFQRKAQLPTIAVGGFVDKLLGNGWRAGF
ncbi:hypothetical protein C4J90_4928 [Pseudomonas sp. R2-60-08W]|nr:hypothetical protein C4J90_4928 [Pseudomonas sp. R2-60-08W]